MVTITDAAIRRAQELAGQLIAGPGRCPICKWPLVATVDEGCVIGNCSYRPDSEHSEYERLRVRDNRAIFDSYVAVLAPALDAFALSQRDSIMAMKLTGRIVTPKIGVRPVYEVAQVIVPRSPDPPKFGHAWEEFGGESWHDACGRKNAYFTRKAAERVLLLVKQRHYRKGKVLGVYECPWCEWFHLGHSTKAAR